MSLQRKISSQLLCDKCKIIIVMCLFNSACTLLQMAVHVFDNIMYNIWCLRTTIIHMQRGRRGLRSKYVDVLNPGGPNTSSSSIGGPPPPAPHWWAQWCQDPLNLSREPSLSLSNHQVQYTMWCTCSYVCVCVCACDCDCDYLILMYIVHGTWYIVCVDINFYVGSELHI